MAPAVLLPTASASPDHVTFHAAKGKLSRPILTGSETKPTFDSIPQIDFSTMYSPHLADRQRLAEQVRAAFTECGFLYACNHGICEDLQSRTLAVIKEFFALPEEEKMKIHINKSPAIRGYENLLETKLDDRTRGDLKEALNLADDPTETEQACPPNFDLSYYPDNGRTPLNQWPSSLPHFRSTIYAYRAAVLDFSQQFLHIIALALNLPETHFDELTEFPMAGLRALHYPPQTAAGDVGLGAHADYSLFTLVNQFSATPSGITTTDKKEETGQVGLEVLNANGVWIPAPPVPNTLVVNVGDFLERMTNGRFISAVHRVCCHTSPTSIVPPASSTDNDSTTRPTTANEKENEEKESGHRYSIPFFFSPSHDVMIETIPSCVMPGEQKVYADINAGVWQRERLLRARYRHPSSVAARARGEI